MGVMAERGQPEQTREVGESSPRTVSLNNLQGPDTSGNTNDFIASDRVESDERKGTSNRGFAAMDREKQKRIASEGGRAAHRQGVAHEWSRDEAREAGRKGGQIVSRNREHMSEIGRKGGQSSGQRRQRNNSEERGE